jgi:plasmid replication initiation protein
MQKRRTKKIVRVHHDVAEAPWTLEALEQKIFLYAAMHMYATGVAVVRKKDLAEVGVALDDMNAAHRRQLFENIMGAKIYLKTEKKEVMRAIVTDIENVDDGFLRFTFNPHLREKILEMQDKHFVRLSTKNIRGLRRKHSIKLYLLLKKYTATMHRVDTIESLKRKLAIGQHYKSTNDFIRYVVDRAVKEINKKTDLTAKYSVRKTGRKITHVEFEIVDRKTLVRAARTAGLEIGKIKTLEDGKCLIEIDGKEVVQDAKDFLRQTADLFLKKTRK